MFVNELIIVHQSILNLSSLPWIEWRSANANLELPLTGGGGLESVYKGQETQKAKWMKAHERDEKPWFLIT